MSSSNKVNRRNFLRTLGLGTAACLVGSCSSGGGLFAQKPKSRPNILFLFADDHAYQAISAYGSKINKTPNIDRIANEGAILLHNTCCNSLCGPSRAAILTGKHSHINGFMRNGDKFDGSQQTFPKLLQKSGYKTAVIGKWHLASDPTGFDYWDILPGQGHYYNPDFINKDGKRRITGYNTDIVGDLALDWLKQQHQQSQDQPFLLMCQFKAPHRPWLPGPKHLNMYDDVTIPEPENLFDDYANRANPIKENEMQIAQHMKLTYDLQVRPMPSDTNKEDKRWASWSSYERMTPEQKKKWDAAFARKNEEFFKTKPKGKDLVRWKYQRYIKDYLRCIASVDDNVGRILDYLDQAGLTDNTLVVYSADQGFYLGEHGMFDKRWMYEESLGMPFVARWPGMIKPKTRVKKLTQNIDFGPTFLQAAGQPVPADMQGESFLPLLRGKNPSNWRKEIYYHYYELGIHNVVPQDGVRTERDKLVHYYLTDEWEYFDLEKDPHEMVSRYNDPACQKRVAELKIELQKMRKLYKVPADNNIRKKRK